MIVALLTSIAAVSVAALYVWQATQSDEKLQSDPARSGADPEFARLGENDWYDLTLSMEWLRP